MKLRHAAAIALVYALYATLLFIATKFHLSAWLVTPASLLIAMLAAVMVIRRLRSLKSDGRSPN